MGRPTLGHGMSMIVKISGGAGGLDVERRDSRRSHQPTSVVVCAGDESMQETAKLIRCTVVNGHLTRDVKISASLETETASILVALPFDLVGRSAY